VAKEFPPSDVLGTLNLFDGLTPVVAPDGHHVFYKKGTASPLFARSLDGDITNNPEESLVDGMCKSPATGSPGSLRYQRRRRREQGDRIPHSEDALTRLTLYEPDRMPSGSSTSRRRSG
jgi:hypothetical protein